MKQDRNRNLFRRLSLAGAYVLIATLILLCCLPGYPDERVPLGAATPSVMQLAANSSTSSSSSSSASPPVHIYFPDADIDGEVCPVGFDGYSIGTVKSASKVAWYNRGAAPTEDGNCIINGHVRWKGKEGTFGHLKSMKVGEEVVIELKNGSRVYYEVTSREEFPYNDFPLEYMLQEGKTRLTLISCKGDFSKKAGTSLTRVVVVCKRTSTTL